MQTSSVNSLRTRCRPWLASLARRLGSRRSSTHASATARGFRGGTSTPTSATASLTPPTSVAIIALPEAMASRTEYGNPSEMLVETTTSPAWYASVIEGIRPSKRAESPKAELTVQLEAFAHVRGVALRGPSEQAELRIR